VLALLDLALENARPLRLVEAGDLEDLSRIEPAVGAAAHDGDALRHPAARSSKNGCASGESERVHLVHGHAAVRRLQAGDGR
jgi:hypothetical protein